MLSAEQFFSSDMKLKKLVISFEEAYFKDMRLELKELKNKYFKHQELHDGKWVTVYDEALGDIGLNSLVDEYVFHYGEMEKYHGECDFEKKEIWVNSKIVTSDKDIKETLLHEMIHGYENILVPEYQQIVLLFLYNKLQKRIEKRKLDKLIAIDQNSVVQVHSPLFLLKSLTIDLARHLPLGTIYYYRREEYFSRFSTSKKGGE